jgi:ubiquinone/menaquinone biosynthesis C-methylase UbiE
MEKAGHKMAMSSYEAYVQSEWDRFMSDQSRAEATLDAVSGLQLKRVLDIGCGAGQEMSPLILRGAFGIGIDLDVEVGKSGRKMFAANAGVAFVRSSAEFLPFSANCFDVLICRLALPYMDNARAIREMARVLQPDGLLMLKIHAAPYYLRKFWRGLVDREILSSVHAARVLVAGMLYHALGFQVRKFLSEETFQSEWLLKRELAQHNLTIRRRMPDSNSLTPSFLIFKGQVDG